MLAPPAQSAAQDGDPSAARSLFEEARGLMKAGRYEAACPKVEAASKLYAGPGVLLNLGDCYERTGRLGSAWTAFGEALSAAVATGRTQYEAEARRRRAALAARVSWLTIRVATDTPDLVVMRDGVSVDRQMWGVATPVDPGPHRVSAENSGHVSWTASIAITAPGESVTVEVPEVPSLTAPVAGASGAPLTPPTSTPGPSAVPQAAVGSGTDTRHALARKRTWGTRRVAAATMGAGGLAGIGASILLVLTAESRLASAQGEVGVARARDSQGAVEIGNAASVTFVLGVTLMAAGTILWLTAPNAPLDVGASGGAMVMRGRF